MTNDIEVLLRFAELGGSRSVLLEDDGRVPYAYLLEGDRIVGDVWLYNVGEDPVNADWDDRTKMLFRIPAEYCTAEASPRLTPDSAIVCHWSEAGVSISLGGIRWAVLKAGSKPGWSRKARIVGPLAKPLARRD